MEVAGATFATWHPTSLLTGYSWDVMSAATLLHSKEGPLNILLLGLAGGTMVRILHKLNPNHCITSVEIDSELVQLAEKHLHFNPATCNVVIGDAYAYLAKTSEHYDIILDDIFLAGAQDVYRPQHADQPLVDLYQRALRPGGIVAINFITVPPHQTTWQDMSDDLKNHFPAYTELRAPRGYNCACVAGEQLKPKDTLREAEPLFTSKQDRQWWRRLLAEA